MNAKKTDDQTLPHPSKPAKPDAPPPKEIGGRDGLDPVRYGDWEVGGKCVDF
ncbi:MAG: DUF1674 domain-containing protein [Micavibrio aeruginosavorus]|uniref:DUF1674 domain-containing protein n=1 Tax=Micavibrio aeruginosavorus TaxID=349221 RepID=A0A2W5A5F9_9BACT|nr:MAG: DUF1674 domain-containing protein [Micavibrio aeruginosavorus]